ncbi:unnamed protein product [Moneuplotes crassus]|uniref:Uncharacterized protein n=1 Tax=Euplotes crassus TaxID=5936 RepID=A0AAD1UHT6_EUPCR|nr:unnamed protein product [Moneuplotes crassus]
MQTHRRKLRITLLGPSFCGKTAIVNRFINNCFLMKYMPTSDVNVYNTKLDLNDEDDGRSYMIDCEIVDTFPLNHPHLLKKYKDDANLKREISLRSELSRKEMETKLRKILNNSFEDPGYKKSKNVPRRVKKINPEFSHALLFIFDCSEIQSFDIVCGYIEAFNKIEESKLSLVAPSQGEETYTTKKMIIGNKSDMKVHDFKKLMDKNPILFKEIEYVETSALVNSNDSNRLSINSIFKKVYGKIMEDPMFEDIEWNKIKNRELEEVKDLTIPTLIPQIEEPPLESKISQFLSFRKSFMCFGFGGKEDSESEEDEEFSVRTKWMMKTKKADHEEFHSDDSFS